MKLKITYPEQRQTVEIEDEPEACAKFLAELERQSRPMPVVERQVHTTRTKPEAPQTGQEQPRTYGGKPNRRHMVLSAMQQLKSKGNNTPTLEDIRTCYSELFPGESVKHLDQVVRDLTNKTHLVERLEWGTFRLR